MFHVISVRYIYSSVWFQCKTSECLVSFKFLSMSYMGSFHWPFHYIKLLSNKIFAGLLICVLATSLLVFWQWILFFSHTYSSLHSSISVQDKNIMMILLYFKFTRTLVFTICPTVMLNIGDIINKVFREELYWCTAANPNFNSENRSSGPETGQQNINAM